MGKFIGLMIGLVCTVFGILLGLAFYLKGFDPIYLVFIFAIACWVYYGIRMHLFYKPIIAKLNAKENLK